MPSKYPMFDRSRLRLLPLSERTHDVDLTRLLEVGQQDAPFEHADLPSLVAALGSARSASSSRILMMGAHVVKQGLSRYVIDLIRKGWITAIALNGACVIHDYELALVGATSESVARYISSGQFGLWKETGQLNDYIQAGVASGRGLGETVGKAILDGNFPHKDVSILAAAYECSVPATVHVGIGYDIIHEHPNFSGAATGELSERDFLIFARAIEGLDGGVLMCYGSAVMGPEVYLKALAMARNVAHQQGRSIRKITSAVFDLLGLSGDLHREAPKDSHEYYYRPYKTILVRTIRDGGQSFYIQGDHRLTMPALHRLLPKQG